MFNKWLKLLRDKMIKLNQSTTNLIDKLVFQDAFEDKAIIPTVITKKEANLAVKNLASLIGEIISDLRNNYSNPFLEWDMDRIINMAKTAEKQYASKKESDAILTGGALILFRSFNDNIIASFGKEKYSMLDFLSIMKEMMEDIQQYFIIV